ncbi:MAG: YtxH domain-containing protein [Chloroflexi bacterium]|jgi:gas vesicle protein|nr:YtxH domain-containing protein [Chloroflexota bacterium]
MYERESNMLSLISVFAIGALIGAAMALLMAPQSGPETRMMLKDKSTEIKDKAVGTAEETRHRAGQTLDEISSKAKERISSLKDRGEEMIDEGRAHF